MKKLHEVFEIRAIHALLERITSDSLCLRATAVITERRWTDRGRRTADPGNSARSARNGFSEGTLARRGAQLRSLRDDRDR